MAKRDSIRATVFWLTLLLALTFGPHDDARAENSEPEGPKSDWSLAQASDRNLIMGTGEARDPQPFTREQRLLDAARRGDRATVERALELGVPVDSADDLSRSALLLAARDASDLDLVRLLQARGGQIDRADAGGRTPLSFTAMAGNIELVRYFVEQGAVVDRPDKRGRTPFFHAVLNNQLETVRFLLDRSVDVNVQDRFGDTPFMMACAKGHEEMAILLLANGADPSIRNQEGRRAADRAAPNLGVCLADKSV